LALCQRAEAVAIARAAIKLEGQTLAAGWIEIVACECANSAGDARIARQLTVVACDSYGHIGVEQVIIAKLQRYRMYLAERG
jgi:hypothetical protein